jgi:hypothetical protein
MNKLAITLSILLVAALGGVGFYFYKNSEKQKEMVNIQNNLTNNNTELQEVPSWKIEFTQDKTEKNYTKYYPKASFVSDLGAKYDYNFNTEISDEKYKPLVGKTYSYGDKKYLEIGFCYEGCKVSNILEFSNGKITDTGIVEILNRKDFRDDNFYAYKDSFIFVGEKNVYGYNVKTKELKALTSIQEGSLCFYGMIECSSEARVEKNKLIVTKYSESQPQKEIGTIELNLENNNI